MMLQRCFLVLIDISGYTRFINWPRTSILHAEQIITELLEEVIDRAEHPLILNKLEGDAAFLYMESRPERTAIESADVLNQCLGFFEAFEAKRRSLMKNGTGGCACDACQNIHALDLKAFIHHGEVVVKTMKQFRELAGGEVILIHRLLKNSQTASRYLLLTQPFLSLLDGAPRMKNHEIEESYEDIGTVKGRVYFLSENDHKPISPYHPPMTRWRGILENIRLWLRAGVRRAGRKQKTFLHLPSKPAP
jgi:hypothetical protein